MQLDLFKNNVSLIQRKIFELKDKRFELAFLYGKENSHQYDEQIEELKRKKQILIEDGRK